MIRTSHNNRVSGFVPSALRPNPAFGCTSDTRIPLSESGKNLNEV